MTTLLHVRNLRKNIGRRRLLDIDSLVIPEATCIVLSGRNGVGKTTLLKILAGLVAPDHAEVVCRGQTLPWKLARRRFRHETVYLHQQPYMFDRSVAENLAYGLRRSGLPRDEIARRVAAGLAWAGLTHLADRNARQLSGGEKQRVALTRARMLSPRLLLLDEPTANMDLESREQTIRLIRRLGGEGISTIVTTHEPRVANSIGDRHLHLCKNGPCRNSVVRPFLYQRNEADAACAPGPGTNPEIRERMDKAMPENDVPGGYPRGDITGVILAGGLARRMGGADKGLLPLLGRPMIEQAVARLQPQVGHLLVNANRNREQYARLGLPLVADMMGDHFGPLVGIASAMQVATTPLLLSVPCDSPLLPQDLAQRLYAALVQAEAEISVAHDGERMQPVFALLRRDLLPSLLAYLQAGGRKIDTWYRQHRLVLADFSDRPDTFLNINTPEQQADLEARLRRQQHGRPGVPASGG